MVVAVWPVEVSFIASPSSVSESGPQKATVRTTMDKGADKVRARFTGATKLYAGSTDSMTTTQTLVIEDFYGTDLVTGSLPFTATHPRTGVTETFRFLAPPDYVYEQNSDDLYRVRLSLEILP